MRLIVFFLPLVALAARGQETWTYLQTSTEANVFITDIAFDLDGSTICYQYQNSDFVVDRNGGLVRINNMGLASFSRSLGGEGRIFLPNNIISGTDSHLHIVGAYSQLLDSSVGFAHYTCLPSGTVLDSAAYQISGFARMGLENAALTNEGNIFIGGSGAILGQFFTYSTILQIGQNGDSLNYLEFGSANSLALQITRDVKAVANGILLSIEKPYANAVDYRILDDNLDFLDGWSGLEPHADPDPFITSDSLLGGALTLRPLSNGKYIVGGQIEDVNYDRRSAVYKIDDTGAVLAIFSPSTTYPNDYSALTSTLDNIDDSTFYFLSWKNIALTPNNAPYAPYEPDQIVVYKLDNALNVLCQYVLDGFVDNAYYVPNRIKTSPDGGFVLLGGRKDMTIANSNFEGWAQKFAPSDCMVGVHENAVAEQVPAFPNPGRDGFSILLNGPVTDGMLELFDATGKLKSTTAMHQSRAHVDAQGLATGLYLYRVFDAKGKFRGTGKWQKE